MYRGNYDPPPVIYHAGIAVLMTLSSDGVRWYCEISASTVVCTTPRVDYCGGGPHSHPHLHVLGEYLIISAVITLHFYSHVWDIYARSFFKNILI